eukprot:g8166.t1
MVRSGLQKRKGGRKRKKKKKTAHDTSTTSRSSKLLEEVGHDTFAQELGLAPADDPDEEENDAEDHEVDSLELECGDDGIDEEVAAGGAGGDESKMFLSADTTALVEDETNGDAEGDSCDAEILNCSATAAAAKKGRNSKSKSANNAPVVENANKKTKKTSFRLAASRVLQETKNSKNRKRAIETGQAIISSQLAAWSINIKAGG